MAYFFSRVDFKMKAYKIALFIRVSYDDQLMTAIFNVIAFIAGK